MTTPASQPSAASGDEPSTPTTGAYRPLPNGCICRSTERRGQWVLAEIDFLCPVHWAAFEWTPEARIALALSCLRPVYESVERQQYRRWWQRRSGPAFGTVILAERVRRALMDDVPVPPLTPSSDESGASHG